MNKIKPVKTLIKASTLAVVLTLLAGCSDTIYGIPKSEWRTLSPQEKQQAAASANLGKSHMPAIFQIFEKPVVAPEQAAKQDLAVGNN